MDERTRPVVTGHKFSHLSLLYDPYVSSISPLPCLFLVARLGTDYLNTLHSSSYTFQTEKRTACSSSLCHFLKPSPPLFSIIVIFCQAGHSNTADRRCLQAACEQLRDTTFLTFFCSRSSRGASLCAWLLLRTPWAPDHLPFSPIRITSLAIYLRVPQHLNYARHVQIWCVTLYLPATAKPFSSNTPSFYARACSIHVAGSFHALIFRTCTQTTIWVLFLQFLTRSTKLIRIMKFRCYFCFQTTRFSFLSSSFSRNVF